MQLKKRYRKVTRDANSNHTCTTQKEIIFLISNKIQTKHKKGKERETDRIKRTIHATTSWQMLILCNCSSILKHGKYENAFE